MDDRGGATANRVVCSCDSRFYVSPQILHFYPPFSNGVLLSLFYPCGSPCPQAKNMTRAEIIYFPSCRLLYLTLIAF